MKYYNSTFFRTRKLTFSTECVILIHYISIPGTFFYFVVCLMLRVDSAGIESSLPTKMSLEAEGMKLSSISPTTPTFLCVKSSDIKVSIIELN